MLRLSCGSTVWPASQCNPQTIPCCYSITRSAAVLLLLPAPLLLLLLQTPAPATQAQNYHLTFIYLARPDGQQLLRALRAGEEALHLKHTEKQKTKSSFSVTEVSEWEVQRQGRKCSAWPKVCGQ